MIIKDIRTTCLHVPYTDPPKPGFDIQVTTREMLVAEVECGDGVVGVGFLHPLTGGLPSIERFIHEVLAPIVVGREATEVEALWDAMFRATRLVGRMGVALHAMSALDVALWDAVGKQTGLPLYRLWGGTARDLPVYGSGCFRGLGREGMIEKALRYRAQGFSHIKMQVAHVHTPLQDVENVRAMREALGPEAGIMIDVNMGWTADEAIHTGHKLVEHDVYWLEEPVVAEDFAGYRRVAAALPIRIVGGENHFTRHDMRPFFEHPCLPILQPDFMRCGLTEMRRIATVADTWGMRIAPHLFHELMSHVVAAIPNGDWLEYMGWYDDLWVEPVPVREGKVRPPDRPGHGLEFKPEILRDCRVTL